MQLAAMFLHAVNKPFICINMACSVTWSEELKHAKSFHVGYLNYETLLKRTSIGDFRSKW